MRSTFAFCLGLALSLTGCGGSGPFTVAPVAGKVSYEDGTLIPADRLVIRFIPQDIKAVGKDVPSAALGEVNPADGTFPGVTTVTFQDGAIPGKHKVIVEAFKNGPGGNPMPSDSVPERYRSEKTTTLIQEIPSGGKRDVTIKIEKK